MTKAEKRRKAQRISRMAMRMKPHRGGLEPLLPKGFGLVPEHVKLSMIHRANERVREIPHYTTT